MFRKFAIILMITVVCFFTVGCYSIKMAAPSNENVKLIPATKPITFKKEIRNWYLLWGLVPISDAGDGVRNVIKENNLTEVRLETKAMPIDAVINLLLFNGILGAYTTIIEGNSGNGGSSSNSTSSGSTSSGSIYNSAPNLGSGSDESSPNE